MLSQWQSSPSVCLVCFLLQLSFAISSAASSLPTCTPQQSIPIHYPMRNVTLSDSTLRRGAAVSFGTPRQPFAFLISPSVSFRSITTGSECLTNLGNTTTHISMMVESPAAVSTTQGCSAQTNTAACLTREVRQCGLQQISPH